jgi:hypothetical protein
MSGTPLYKRWLSMKSRTTPGTAANRRGYVDVRRDPRWDTFEGFLENQPAGQPFGPGLELARNGDVGDYTPENTRWATRSENTQEMLSRRKLKLPDGQFATDVARVNGVPTKTWDRRYRTGMSLTDAVSTSGDLRRRSK